MRARNFTDFLIQPSYIELVHQQDHEIVWDVVYLATSFLLLLLYLWTQVFFLCLLWNMESNNQHKVNKKKKKKNLETNEKIV